MLRVIHSGSMRLHANCSMKIVRCKPNSKRKYPQAMCVRMLDEYYLLLLGLVLRFLLMRSTATRVLYINKIQHRVALTTVVTSDVTV